MLLPDWAKCDGAQDQLDSRAGSADYTIEIAEIEWEIAPKKKVHTSAYNSQIPGKLLRLTEGKPVTIDIVNRLDRPEIVHWHGQWIPSDVDGSSEEGTPMIPAGGRTRIQFTPKPSGLHWYHTHTSAARDLKRGLYSGQFGPLYVEPRENPGHYDQEHFLMLHEWDPYFAASDDGSQEIGYASGSINGRMLGHADPIQVRAGDHVLFHIVNASATQPRWLSLPGHWFEVVALDGRPVPTRARNETLYMGPAERISAIVTMDHPGVWILGEVNDDLRGAGIGTVIEYAGQSGAARWKAPANGKLELPHVWGCEPKGAGAGRYYPARVHLEIRGSRHHGSMANQWKVVSRRRPRALSKGPASSAGLRQSQRG